MWYFSICWGNWFHFGLHLINVNNKDWFADIKLLYMESWRFHMWHVFIGTASGSQIWWYQQVNELCLIRVLHRDLHSPEFPEPGPARLERNLFWPGLARNNDEKFGPDLARTVYIFTTHSSAHTKISENRPGSWKNQLN